MVLLERMPPQDFGKFRQFSIDNYARALVRNLRIPFRMALSMAKTESEEALPHGYYSAGHQFYHIKVSDTGAEAGYIWFVVNEKGKSAFLYDLYIEESFRAKGFAKSALKEAEQLMRKQSVTYFRLNVFQDNHTARKLYEDIGFYPCNTIMQKEL